MEERMDRIEMSVSESVRHQQAMVEKLAQMGHKQDALLAHISALLGTGTSGGTSPS
jgi:hypothetical protein